MRIAILLVGLSRTYRETYQSLLNLINNNRSHQFDIFITTWNIKGNVTKEKSIYKVNRQGQKWLDDEELITESDINLLKTSYQPKSLRIIHYQKWKVITTPIIDEMINKLNLQSQRNFVESSLFSQYYAIQLATTDLINYATSNHIEYDLVIKTRFDLYYEYDENQIPINWQQIKNHVDDDQIVSMKNWVPKGISDQIIIGNTKSIQRYAELYSKLPNLTIEDINKIKLVSFYLPDIYMHYDIYDNDNDKDKEGGINPNTFYQKYYEEIKRNMLIFLDSGHDIIFPIIAERFLLYFLNKIQKIDVYVEEFIDITLVRDDGTRYKANNMKYFKTTEGEIGLRSANI